MKVKTFHALLLSIVMITGAVTINDAFAQTNTDRLTTVADTTADTNSRVVQLTEIWNNFGSQFTPITDALNIVAEEITAISDEISTLSNDITATSAKVDSLEDKLDNYAATRASDSAEIMGQIDTLADVLPDIQDKISTLAGDTSVGDLVGKVDDIAAQLNDFSSALGTIQSEVQEIQSELGIITTTTIAETGPAPTDLNDGMVEQDILAKWYAQGLKEIPDDKIYNAEYYFTCESDVFIRTVDAMPKLMVDIRDNNIGNTVWSSSHGDSPTDPTYDTNLLVNKQTIFDTHHEGTGDSMRSHELVDFKLMELKAGEVLTFESITNQTGGERLLDLYTSTTKNTDVAAGIADGNLVPPTGETTNATKADLGDAALYSVTVNYYSEATDAKCEISPAGTAPLDNIGQQVFVTPTISGEGILAKYDAKLDCDLNNVRITDISATLTGADGLNDHVTMELMVDGDDDTKVEFTFANNSLIVDPDSLPIELRAKDLNIEGNIVGGAELLIAFTYDTVQDVECKEAE